MAGFYPHIGIASAGFTALPIVSASAFLDQVVSDVGAGVNGWTVYDDLRSGSSYPLWWPVVTQNGIFNQNGGGNQLSWTFTSGSTQAYGNTTYGYHWAYVISGISGSPTPISVNSNGANAYSAYFSSWPSNVITATLDRPYAEATGNTKIIYRKLTKYIVLKQASSTKNFYVLLAQSSDAVGSPNLYMRVFESWDSVAHSGTQGSAIESTPFWLEGTVDIRASMRYVLWLLPDVFGLWTAGMKGWGTVYESFSYVGNLDTTGIRTGDTDALVFIPGITQNSGYATPNVPAVNSPVNYCSYGAAQCLRTLQGYPWTTPTGWMSGMFIQNSYHVYARGRWYAYTMDAAAVDLAGKFEFTDLDLWHAGYSYVTAGVGSPNEGRRGMLRYVKVPVSNPSGMNLASTGPAADGTSYLIFRQSDAMASNVNGSTGPTMNTTVGYVMGCTAPILSGWSFSSKIFNNTTARWGDWSVNSGGAGQNGYFNYLMMPIV